MTRARQEQVLKNQQERARAQASENRANSDNRDNRVKSKNSDTQHSTPQPDDTVDETNGISDITGKKPKGKALHPNQIKSSKKNRKVRKKTQANKVPNYPPSDTSTTD